MIKYFSPCVLSVLSMLSVLCVMPARAQDTRDDALPDNQVKAVIDGVRNNHAPDKRTAIFEVSIENANSTPMLKGITTEKAAKEELLQHVRAIYPNVIDSVALLPDASLGAKTLGIIRVSVADMRVKPGFEYEMATQSIFGTPVRILETKGGWSRVRTPDSYISWVQNIAFEAIEKKDELEWTMLNDKLIFTDYYGFSYSEPNNQSEHISDLVAGSLLHHQYQSENEDFYKVLYPDGRTAYVKKSQSKPFETWENEQIETGLTAGSIIRYARSLMGIPYMWGGTSTKGMDCSGFTKTIYFMHGVILMRDASQQAFTGTEVDVDSGYDLQAGDLMFFGKKGEDGKKDRIRHVGIYLGDNEFIHASGYIRISSLDPSKPHYDEKNTTEFIRARRITSDTGLKTKGVWQITNNPAYEMLHPPKTHFE